MEPLYLVLGDAEAEVAHELLAGVGLDHPRQHGHVLCALKTAADDLQKLKGKSLTLNRIHFGV